MTTIPQLRQDINAMRERALAAEAERDALRVRLATRPKPEIITKEVVKVVKEVVEKPVTKVVEKVVEKPVAKTVEKVVERVVEKRVPTPCRKQAKELAEAQKQIEALQKQIQAMPKPDDVAQYNKWRKMVQAAKGAT